ncbi:beta-ketoacyl-[acyl-carrier-protein] synthase family protein [Streptomyces sp. 110]|uniref:Beta-ketoacyl-[acyl-carrier-protein] synthase family protein n=1 Tax=Streptomyces endocoffeicus TaxID=2898945 RepID=A0ABS1PSC6_9ACTN|nr:beta-ketoacyl-[acyl-carrier-protein] synthase family protein [Streptomyces endocoffeicus]MBL1115338.1 beta-ketoacyl-[acyl-carrier-protein] synthase family protein [Streptomyces endocoffeicus]
MKTEIAVTGLGLITPAGIGRAENWERVCDGRGLAAADPELAGGLVEFSCRVPSFNAAKTVGAREVWRTDRFVQLALVAAEEAVADAGLDPGSWDGSRVGIVVGCAAGGVATFEVQQKRFIDQGSKGVSALFHPMALVNMVSGRLAIQYGATGPSLVTATACASGATAIAVARDLLVSGACDVVLAGGTEAAVTPTFVAGFARMGALYSGELPPEQASRPFDARRGGFVIGEGAGILVLERLDDARTRHARVWAGLLGCGASSDAHHTTSPRPGGLGIESAMRLACRDAGVEPERVGHVNAHGTSTPLNDAAEAGAIARLGSPELAVTSTKGVTGHTLGAAGAVEAAYTVLSLAHQTIPPTANLTQPDPDIQLDVVSGAPRKTELTHALSNSAGFGGHNVSLLFGV